MTALLIAQQVAAANGWAVPASLRQAGGEGERILPLIQTVGDELALLRGPDGATWPMLQREHEFETVSGRQWYSLPPDLGQILSDTMWDRTSYRPVSGQMSPQAWQAVKGRLIAYPALTYRQRRMFNPGTHRMDLRLDPVPTEDGRLLAFEYASANWIRPRAGAAPTERLIKNDLDTPVFPFNLMKAGVEWMARRARGLPYQSQQAVFELQVQKELGRETNPRRVYPGRPPLSADILTANLPESGYGLP